MDIKFKNSETQLFRNILTGRCFMIDFGTPNQTICIKTTDDDTTNVNAVDLQDGIKYHFEDNFKVVPLNAELKVWLLDD